MVPVVSHRYACPTSASDFVLRLDPEDDMTTAKEGEELTRVGRGTVMGELMRCYWIPALMSSELVSDGPPIRLMLLGEKLIAFRDSQGRVGVMDHGWKFDVAGNCMDMPSVPPPDFKQKVRARAYSVTERAGVIWVYMGTRAE